ncbi:24306_t:CDS:2, partial [Cetraspora pellucida]
TFTACGNASGCTCDKNNNLGGLKCGHELNNHKHCFLNCPSDPSSIFQCSPNGTNICQYGSCSNGCCAVDNEKSYCYNDDKCLGHSSYKWIKKESYLPLSNLQPSNSLPFNLPPSNLLPSSNSLPFTPLLSNILPLSSNPLPSTLLPSNPSLPNSPSSGYNRQKAVNYARKYCKNANLKYKNYNLVDCTNFASQVNCEEFYDYLISYKLAKECQLSELKPGDFIQYLGSKENYLNSFLVFLISSAFATCSDAGGCICDKNDNISDLKSPFFNMAQMVLAFVDMVLTHMDVVLSVAKKAIAARMINVQDVLLTNGLIKTLTVDYAGQNCKNANSKYKIYISVDCTNFASQVLNAGSVFTNQDWKPYTYTWINVEVFYDYLISHKLAKECQLSKLKPGDFIQYLSPQKYSHTVVVVKSGADPTVDSQ